MSSKLHEPVIVGAIFGHETAIKPAWFIFGGRKIRISSVHHAWIERQGQTVLRHFSVSDGEDTFHIVMNSETLTWHMEGVGLA